MNQVSWFIYWAGVLSNVGPFLIGLGLFVGGVGTIANGIFWAARMDDVYGTMDERAAAKNKIREFHMRLIPMLWAGGALLLFAAVFIPDRNTLYAMAAAEVAGQIAQTPEFSKARGVLDKALDRIDAKLSEDSSSSSSSKASN